MKPKIIYYKSWLARSESYLAIMKNGFVIDIACSEKKSGMYSQNSQPEILENNPFFINSKWINITKVQARDLALYTHWPVHTKEFWDLLNET